PGGDGARRGAGRGCPRVARAGHRVRAGPDRGTLRPSRRRAARTFARRVPGPARFGVEGRRERAGTGPVATSDTAGLSDVELLLVRHGIAESRDAAESPDDRGRPLTAD